MLLKSLLTTLRNRVPFSTMSAILKLSEFPVSQGADKTVERIIKEVGEGKEDYTDAIKKLNQQYQDHLLVSEKAVRFYPVDKERTAKLAKLITKNEIENSDFLALYPISLSEEQLSETTYKISLVDLVESEQSLSLVYCSSRFIQERVKIDTSELNSEVEKELSSYDEVYGIKKYFYQFFNVVVLWKNKPFVEVRIDLTRDMPWQDRRKYALEVVGEFNKLTDKVLGVKSFLRDPVNFFPLIKKLYDAKDEGKVGELAFTTDEGSIKNEKMRVGMVDLRDETYHKAGRAAVEDICPYRIAVLWESPISETLGIKNNLELFLQGTCRSLSSENQILEDVIIKKCSFLEEYKFVFDKINQYLWNDNV